MARPLLEKGLNKDFVLHAQGVLAAVKLIAKEEGGDLEILIPAAILHDVGWAKVPNDNQKTKDTEKRAEGEKLHLIFGAELAGDIMQKLDYSDKAAKEVAKIIKSHMDTEPNDKNTKILIDADALSDVFRDNFYAESKA